MEDPTGWPSKTNQVKKAIAEENLDGDDSDDGNVSNDEMPFAIPTVQGWTVVGVGGNQGLLFRNGTGGHVSNVLLCNTSEGIEIEDKADEVEDAYERWAAGDLTLSNVVVTGGVDALDYDGDAEDGDSLLDDYAANNMIVNDDPTDLDYLFEFDEAGGMAVDQLFLNAGVGSGHDFALGWTFCDERELFGESANAVPGCTDENACNYDASATVDDGSCDVVTVSLEGTVAGGRKHTWLRRHRCDGRLRCVLFQLDRRERRGSQHG